MRSLPRAHSCRALELFCGVGGFAAATGDRVEIVAAVDINRVALEVYRHNFDHPVVAASVESIPRSRLQEWDADLWWLSPPCQPFTRRGRRLDTDDLRSAGLLGLFDRITAIMPMHIVVENVPGFVDSQTHRRLRDLLEKLGYDVQEQLLCPTRLGIPNRRERFYLIGSQEALTPPTNDPGTPRPLSQYLDHKPSEDLWVEPDLETRYPYALNIVDADGPNAIAACFTSAYGRSPIRSGSYLQTARGLRRFSPAEILRLLGFPEAYSLPEHLPKEVAWRLLGNSVSLPAVRCVLSAIPSIAGSSPPTLNRTDHRALVLGSF
jgi:site-specific DNA-cytosine methylase